MNRPAANFSCICYDLIKGAMMNLTTHNCFFDWVEQRKKKGEEKPAKVLQDMTGRIWLSG